VWGSGSAGVACALAALATGNYGLFQLGFVASFTSKLSDTVSSEVGKVGGRGGQCGVWCMVTRSGWLPALLCLEVAALSVPLQLDAKKLACVVAEAAAYWNHSGHVWAHDAIECMLLRCASHARPSSPGSI
jgi:uncharacterized membrane protein